MGLRPPVFKWDKWDILSVAWIACGDRNLFASQCLAIARENRIRGRFWLVSPGWHTGGTQRKGSGFSEYLNLAGESRAGAL
jgi:hypothetical protein